MIKIVSFDFDGTIVTHQFADAFWLQGVPMLYAKQNNISETLAQQYIYEEYDKEGDGSINWYDPAYWFKRFNLKTDYNDLFRKYQSSIELYPESASVIKRIAQHYKLIISSNAKREFIDIQLKDSGLAPYFCRIFSSTSDFHTVKKVPDFYTMICQELRIQPQEMIHVGDHKEFDYVSPKKQGIHAYYLDRTKTIRGPQTIHDLIEFEQVIQPVTSNRLYSNR